MGPKGKVLISYFKCLCIIPYIFLVELRRLIVIRPRSRNVARIYPLESWTLPILEFSELVMQHAGTNDAGISFHKQTNCIYCVEASNIDDEAHYHSHLIDATSQSVFVHSLHEEVKTSSLTSSEMLPKPRKWFVSAIIIGDSYCSNDFLEENIIGQYRSVWNRIGGEYRVFDESKAEVSFRVIADRSIDPCQYFITKQLSRGLGSSLEDRHSKREMLSAEDSYRRPNNGLLKSFALSRLPYTMKTTMEPEMALLMCSFAKLTKFSTILDPFCGSCTILLAAAKRNGTITIDIYFFSFAVKFYLCAFIA